jgi:hypothetical protein
MKRIHLLVIAVTASFIPACGGGGSSSSSSQKPVVTPSQPSITVTIASAGLRVGTIGSPYSDTVVASASSGDLSITAQGSLPPGITLGSAGVLDGFPTQPGTFPVTFVATSALTPSISTSKTLTIQVVQKGTVRNDTLAAATQLVCCGTVRASLSPYSTASGVAAPDQDYYKISANPSDKISIDAVAIGTAIDTDTVIEVVDVNGSRMNVCNTPQATTGFNHPCLNDDINPGIVRNSHLEIQLPPTSGVFVVHVLDWLGRARPEMTYELRTAKLP